MNSSVSKARLEPQVIHFSRPSSAARRWTTPLFHGPPGLADDVGAVMFAQLGGLFSMTSVPVLARPAICSDPTISRPAMCFIDDIHRADPAVEEVLYPRLRISKLDLVIAKGPLRGRVRIEMQPFTPGWPRTTRMGLLTTPLRDVLHLPRCSSIRDEGVSSSGPQRPQAGGPCRLSAGAREIAKRARGTAAASRPLLRPARLWIRVVER